MRRWSACCGLEAALESRIRKTACLGAQASQQSPIAAGGGLRATSSCLSALVSPPHAHHGRRTARGRCTCSAAAEFASHQRCGEVPLDRLIPQHLECHRRQQGSIGGHSRIAAAPGPPSNAMHTPTPTGIAVGASVGLVCAPEAALAREPHQTSACVGAQPSQLSPHSGWWRSESDQQLLECTGKPAACASRPVHRTWPVHLLGSG